MLVNKIVFNDSASTQNYSTKNPRNLAVEAWTFINKQWNEI